MSSYKKAILALIIANVIWGGASPIFKLALQNIPPFTLAFFRFGIATLILFPLVHRELHNFHDEVENWRDIIVFALSGVTVNIIFFFLALRLTESINAPIIGSFGPVMVMCLAYLWLGEKVTTRKVLGGFIALSGILVIILKPVLETGFDGSVLGNIFLVFATLGAVINTLVGRHLAHKYPPLPLTFWAFLIGTITFIPLALTETASFPILDYRGWIGIVYGAVFSSAIAYAFHTWGLSKISASEVSLFAYIDPVVAMFIAYPLLGEKPTPLFIVGAILVFGGIYIAERRLNYHPLNKILQKTKSK